MDLLKTKIYLDKINREYARMSADPENIVRLDVDIMLSYVRDMYDALLSDTVASAAPVKKEPVAKQSPPPAPARPLATEPAPPPEEKPVSPPPVVVETNNTGEPLPLVPPKSPAAPASFPAISPEAEALFHHKEAKELSEKLSNLPVPDLRKAISLNDTLLLTRELFGNDNSVYENALATINGFTSMDQAKTYLLDQCIMRYRWTDKKKQETARKFIQLVRRRFS